MSRLTPEAEELLRAGRALLRPADADRERVLRALLPQLGVDPARGSLSDSLSGPWREHFATSTLVAKAVATLIGFSLLGGGLYLLQRSEPAPALAIEVAITPPAAPAPLSTTEPAPVDEAPTGAASTPEPPPPTPNKRTAPGSPSDHLAQEGAILSRAGAELHAGHPASALTTLAEHQRKFPAGVLAQERSAARVQTLCALGRTKEAKVEFARLRRTSPNSPLEGRARKACGAALDETH